MKLRLMPAAALCILPFAPPLWAQQSPAQTLDNAWVNVCAQAVPGTAFFNRCQEIINAGPGSGDRRSAAAIGNNLDTLVAQGRTANQTGELREGQPFGIDYEEDFGRFSIYFNASARNTERDQNLFENGFDSDQYGVNAGFDYRFSGNWFIGGVAGYQKTDTRFDSDAGQLDTSGWSLTGLLNGAMGDGGYFSAYAGTAVLDYDSLRNINYALVLNQGQPNQTTRTVAAAATGETEGDQWFAGAALGFDWHQEALKYGLSVNLDLLDTSIEGYTEQGGNGLAQTYDDRDIRSLTAAVGGDVAYVTSHSWGILTPYARLRFVHEFENDARTLASSFAADPTGFRLTYGTQEPDRNYFSGAIGVTGLMLSGTAWYVEAERLFMHDFLSEWALNAGFRWAF